jgi:acyl-coenzyme A synthetase/AMP-(fatty) acid ligase
MRKAAAFTALAAVVAVAGCTEPASQQVAATQPTVSYHVAGANLTQANASAGSYCSQYGMAARLYNVQPRADGQMAYYDCVSGAPGAVYASNGSAPAPVYHSYSSGPTGTPVTPAQCADALHQARPGGSDYYGPPVAGCPQQ